MMEFNPKKPEEFFHWAKDWIALVIDNEEYHEKDGDIQSLIIKEYINQVAQFLKKTKHREVVGTIGSLAVHELDDVWLSLSKTSYFIVDVCWLCIGHDFHYWTCERNGTCPARGVYCPRNKKHIMGPREAAKVILKKFDIDSSWISDLD